MVRVELWADIVCSWCGIANERVNRALEQFGHAEDVELVHRSFRLMADLPEDAGHRFVDFMASRAGHSVAQVQQIGAQVESIAHADGIEHYHVSDNTIGNTTRVHELLALASSKGVHKTAWDLLFRAHFADRAALWSIDDLVSQARPLGLDEAEVRQALTSRQFRPQVEQEHAEAIELGARGVPFLVVDRKYAVAGAQSVETLVQVLERAWAERAEALA